MNQRLLSYLVLYLAACCACTNSGSGSVVSAAFTIENTPVYVGELTVLLDASSGDPTSWNWTIEGGNPNVSSRQNIVTVFSSTGPHKVTLTVANEWSEETYSLTVDVLCREASSDDTFTSFKKTSNVIYGVTENENMMDIYEPEGDERCSRPAIVLLVEGALGDPFELSSLEPMAISFTQYGYVAAVARYRSGPTSTDQEKLIMYVENQQDAKAAVRYLRNEVGNLRIDPEQIFIGGHGVGADISMVAAYLTVNEIPNEDKGTFLLLGGLDGKQGHLEYSNEVAGVFSSSGAIFEDQAMPLIIDKGEVPIFAVHGENDPEVLVGCRLMSNSEYQCGAQAIVERARAENIQSELFIIEGGTHSTSKHNPELYMRELVTFFAELQ